MIGVIGGAPSVEEVACASPGNHGGNMDCCKIRKGSQIILPVYHPGALLALGDVHACMGGRSSHGEWFGDCSYNRT